MKHKMFSLIAISGLFIVLCSAQASKVFAEPLSANVAGRAMAGVGIEFFHAPLAPYGRWFQHEKYGLVWTCKRQ